ncbi:hypothetical protein Tco_0693920 [Tanacetum coccineum]
MQQKIKRLQAHLGDQNGKSKDTSCVSNTLDHLSQKLENENVELEFQDPQKVDERNDLSNPVTSNSVPTPQESKVVKNDTVIAPGMFRINPSKTYREEESVPINKVRASVRTNPITISQPHVITKKHVNSESNGLSSTGVDNTAKNRRPQPRNNIKNDRVPSTFKSSCIKNKEVEVEEHHRNLLLSKNKKHMSSKCNNVKLAIRNDKSEVIYAMCKECLINSNHDVCVLNYVNGMNSHNANQSANVSNVSNQKKHKPNVRKSKMFGSKERLASPTPSKPGFCLRWSPTGQKFDLKGKIITSSEFELIMEYLVNISKRRAFWSLNKDILKITILTPNTSYPSRKIRQQILLIFLPLLEDILIKASRLKKVMKDKGNKSSMETFAPNDKADYYFEITSITVNEKNAYELKGKFLDDLHNNAFSGTNGKDAFEHIEYYQKIIDPIKLPNLDHDKLRIVVFPISLAGGTRRWFDRTKESITCWVELTANFFRKYYPPSRIEGNNTPEYWKMSGDEIEVSDVESSNLKEYWSDKEEETAKIFKRN